MPRIRSIKPEFATDGDILRLSDSAALFFILLWPQCDDEGKHRLDLKQICAELGGRWRPDKVRGFLRSLAESGQIQLGVSSESVRTQLGLTSDPAQTPDGVAADWLRIVSWHHQKIDRPKQPRVKAADIRWFSAIDSTNALESSRTIDARIGSDQGSDRIKDRIHTRRRKPAVAAPSPDEPPMPTEEPVFPTFETEGGSGEPPREVQVAQPREMSPTQAFIVAYCEAFKAKYGTNPPSLKGKPEGIAKRLVERMGAKRAIALLPTFFASTDLMITRSSHDLVWFEQKLTALTVEHETGNRTSDADARMLDAQDYHRNQARRLAAEYSGGGDR